MSLLIPSVSNELILNFILGKQEVPSTQTLRLFKNDYIPTKNSILSDLIEEDVDGYNPITLDSSNWIIETISGVTSSDYPEQTFVLTERTIIYGYYITVNINSLDYLLFVERFSNAPYEFPDDGGSVSVSLNIGSS